MSKRSVSSKTSTYEYERCCFDALNREDWKTYASVGSVLDVQLMRQGKATRCTQTNWKWRQMAERWRHAKVMEARNVTISASASERGKKAIMEKLMKELKELRTLTSTEKAVDTLDLEFDPIKVPAEYIHRHSSTQNKYVTRGLAFAVTI